MRKSKQRDLILEKVKKSYCHPTAYMIYNMCKEEMPSISLGTVYRNLNNLVMDMKIKRIKMPDNIDRFDRIEDFHAHFICINCNQIEDFNLEFNLLKKKINSKKIVDYEISFKGICKNCLDNKGGKNGTKRK